METIAGYPREAAETISKKKATKQSRFKVRKGLIRPAAGCGVGYRKYRGIRLFLRFLFKKKTKKQQPAHQIRIEVQTCVITYTFR